MISYPRYNQWLDYWIERHADMFNMFLFLVAIVLLYLLWRLVAGKWAIIVDYVSTAFWVFFIFVVYPPASLLLVIVLGAGYKLWNLVKHLKQPSPIVLIVLLGAILRIPGMFENLWTDETVTAALAQVPISQLGALAGDTHPPLFYLPFWVSGHLLGYSEFALRLPSLILGILLIYVVYKFTLALGLDERTALVAALIVAVMPGAIRYANEARGYALFAVSVITLAYAILTDRPMLFANMACVAILTQNMGYLYVAVLGLVSLYFHHDKRWLLWYLLPAIIGLFWLPFMFRQLESVSQGWWVVMGPGAVVRPLYSLTIGVRVWDNFLFQLMLAVTVFTFLALGFSVRWLRSKSGLLWSVLVFATPMAAAVLSYLVTPVYVDRAFIPSFMVLPITWAYLLTHINQRVRRPALVVFIPMLLIALTSYYFSDKNARQDWNSLLHEGCGDAQTVYNTSLTTYFITRYYLPDRTIVVWDRSGDMNLFLPDSTITALNINLVSMIPSGEVCLLDIDTWLSRSDERAYRDELLSLYPPVSSMLVLDNDLFPTWTHILEVAYEQ